jgi:PrtD family type I secretion system ABC transporter
MSERYKHKSKNMILRELRSGLFRSLFVVGLFSLLTNALELTTVIYMFQMFDRVIPSGNIDTLILLTVIAGGALITMVALQVIETSIAIRLGNWFVRRFNATILSSTISSASKNGKAPSSRVLDDLNSVHQVFRRATIVPLLDIPWAPIFILIIYILNPTLGWVAIWGGLLMLVLAIWQDRITAFIAKQTKSTSRPAREQAKSLLHNSDAAIAMGMVPALTNEWNKQNGEALDLQARKETARATFSAVTKFVTNGERMAIMCVGVLLIVQNELTMGTMMAAVILSGRGVAPIAPGVKAWRPMTEAIAAFKRIWKLVESLPPDQSSDLEMFHAPRNNLSIQRISFRYSGSKLTALRRVSLDLQPGDALGVVGPAGSGKSTFAKLVTGIFKPRSGQILLDDAPIGNVGPEIRAVHIGYLPQETQLFDGTIHENISRMQFGMRQAAIEAAKLAGVHDAIIRLPDGYDTWVSNDESVLSRGEIQLISLARAIFGDPRLVVLDEPSTKLDKSNEKLLLGVIQALKDRGTVVIVISHRSAILRRCNRILTLPEGKVSDAGARENLKLTVINDEQNLKALRSSGGADG